VIVVKHLGPIAVFATTFGAGGILHAQEVFPLSLNPIEAQFPRYELRLSPIEFSVLHGAALDGVSKYGGDADFEVKLAKESGDEIITTVTITNPRLLDVWTFWMAEKTAQLLNHADLDQLDESAKVALKAVQTINAKLVEAKQDPIYEITIVTGLVVSDKNGLRIDTDAASVRISSEESGDLTHWMGKPVLATGYVKTPGVMDVEHVVEYKPNTLEVFVMSQCPFGTQAEYSIIKYLHGLPHREEVPHLEVHYLFYEKPPESRSDGKPMDGGTPSYFSLHGEREVEENLVQIVLRDDHPELFFDYLLHRASSEMPWPDLAMEVGLGMDDVAVVRDRIVSERDALIQAERDYCIKNYQISDGSPTFVWESRLAPDIHKVKPFAKLDFSAPKCVGTP